MLNRLTSGRFLAPLALLLMAAATDPALAALPPNIESLEPFGGISPYRLKSNGMTILVSHNPAAPVFSFMVVYGVGSRNEAPGNTGSAHLLEHLLFNKSTLNYGKANGHPTFQEILYAAGADFSSTNMTTWNDRMTGYSTLPKSQLELALKIEADRLGRGLLLDAERQPEMSVVRNEYEIGENDPDQALWKAVIGAAIVAHPYHWDTIGYRSDIEGVPTEKLREHYDTYFHPDNATAILVGDFDLESALTLFDREFGSFPKSERPIPKIITVEPPQEGERRVTIKRPGSVGIVQIGYLRPGSMHPDFMPMEVLNSILSDGVNSRLYQSLVETGLATSAFATNFTFRDPYPLMIDVQVAPGKNHAEVEETIKATLARLALEGVSAAEMERARKQIEVAVIRGRDGTFPLCSSLGEAVASADWKWFVTYIDRMKAVSAADVKRVASLYLIPDRATVGWFVPTSAEQMAPLKAAAEAMNTALARPDGSDGPGTAASFGSSITAAAGSAGTFAERTTHRVLSNGIVLDVVENHAVPTVAISGLLLAGQVTAPTGKPGVPTLTGMMMERGTTSRDKKTIGDQLARAGANLFIGTGALEMFITGNGMSRDIDLLLDILADQLKNPSFPDSEYTKVLAEYQSDILDAAENTGQRATEQLSRIVYPEGHPYRQSEHTQLLLAMKTTTLDDLRAWHKSRIVGSSLKLAIVGDIKAEDVAAKVEAFFAGLPRGVPPALEAPRISPKAAQKSVVTIPGKANMNFIAGQASGLRRTDSDFEAALIANAALGQNSLSSRIGKRVRDTEGLSYSLSSRFTWTDALDGLWLVNVNVAPQNLSKAMASTMEVIRAYAKEGITEAEVATGKSYFAGNYQVRLGSNAGVARALVEAEKFGFGPGYLDEYPERFRRVTKAEVDAALKKHLDPAKLNTIVAGDLTTLP
ncbi:MAG: pitrilysin family protein [Candidatus Eisenbacteria bacterium]|nr:pitrilysin family protein [Candidatus Eisenbacteria bacterium]